MKTSEAWRIMEEHFDHYARTGEVRECSLRTCICVALAALPPETLGKMCARIKEFMSDRKTFFNGEEHTCIYPRTQVYARNRACLCAYFARESEKNGD